MTFHCGPSSPKKNKKQLQTHLFLFIKTGCFTTVEISFKSQIYQHGARKATFWGLEQLKRRKIMFPGWL